MRTRRDDGLEWLREIRREMAAEFRYDPKKMGAFYRRMQQQFRDRLHRKRLTVATQQ